MRISPRSIKALILPLVLLAAVGLFLVGCSSDVCNYSCSPRELWIPRNTCCNEICAECEPEPICEAGKVFALDELVDIGLTNNPLTRSAWFQAKAAADRLGEAYSTYYPHVDVNANTAYKKTTNVIIPGHAEYTQYGGGFDIGYLLYNFGKREANVESFREQLYSINYDFNQVYYDVVRNINVFYFRFIAAKESLNSSQATLKDAQTAYESADERLKQGVGTKQDELRAYASVKNAEARIQADLAAIEVARASLAKSIGVNVNKCLEIKEVEDDISLKELDEAVGCLLAKALKNRPLLMAAYATMLSKAYEVEVAERNFFPELLVDVSNNTNHLSSRIINKTSSFNVTLALQWNIFDGFNKEYKLLEARANEKSAEANVRAVELQVVSEVWEYYYGYKAALKQLEATEFALAASQEAFNAIQLGYKVGTTGIVEVLQALVEIALSREFYVQSKANVFISLANLAHAVGAPNNYLKK